MGFRITQPFAIFTDLDGQPLNNGAIYIGTLGQNPETNPITVYWDSELTIPAAQPIRTIGGYPARGGTPSNLYAAAGGSVTVRNASGHIVFSGDLRDLYGESSGASRIGFIQSGAGAVARTVEEVLLDGRPTPGDYGAVGNGIANDTTALQKFFAAAIVAGRGHIPKGTYLVTEGALVLDNAWVDTAFPDITTDGYESVVFLAANSANAPLLTISNGTAASSSERFWRGGRLGGITFKDTSGAVAGSRHGLSLRGIWGTEFGVMRGIGLRGDVVRIPSALFGGTNPDPYAVALCTLAGVEGQAVAGMTFNNDNGVGFSGCTIGFIRAALNGGGVFRGFGSSNTVNVLSAGSCFGWALDDGGASLSRITIGACEIDNCEFGVRANSLINANFIGLRFVHRYQTAPNAAANYWPREAVSLGYTTSTNIRHLSFNIWHRIESGGVKADLGVLTNFNSAGGNINAVDVALTMSDPLGLVDGDLYTGLSANSTVRISSTGKVIVDQQLQIAAVVASSSTQTVSNTGYGTAASKITFPTEVWDRSGHYDAVNSEFIVPATGLYHVRGTISLSVAAGTRIRLAFAVNISTAPSIVADAIHYSQSANPQSYDIDAIVSLSAGQLLSLIGDQNTAAPVSLNAGTTANRWSVRSVGMRA